MDPRAFMQELQELKQARRPAVVVVVFALAVGWFGATAFYAERIAVLDARLAAVEAVPSQPVPAGNWRLSPSVWIPLGFTAVVIAGVLTFLFWGNPSLSTGDDPIVEAAKKRIRIAAGGHLRNLYENTARHAIGDAMQEAGAAIHALQRQPTDESRKLAADMMVDLLKSMENTLQPMLNDKDCATEEQLVKYLRAWGTLFARYQLLVHSTSRANAIVGRDTWTRINYIEWRERDQRFLAGLQQIEHMDGCQHLAIKLREAGWGDDVRPTRPANV